MRIPFAKLEGVEVTQPGKSGNTMNAGIDFYIPTKGSILEFNPGMKDEGAWTPYLFKDEFCTGYERLTVDNPIRNMHDFSILGKKQIPRFNKTNDAFILHPGENVLVHSGIAVEIDLSQFGLVCNRSGIASKTNCVVGAHLIDTGYANELMFDIHNIGLTSIEIKPGMKITQLVIGQFISCDPIEMEYKELYSHFNNLKFRGLAGFGSSDKK